VLDELLKELVWTAWESLQTVLFCVPRDHGREQRQGGEVQKRTPSAKSLHQASSLFRTPEVTSKESL
jgi:hypothetical protein